MDNKNSILTETKKPALREPIAIIGMSCRFPQAPSCEAFWELLKNGKDTITEIPETRWPIADWYDPDPQASRKTHQRHASMLDMIDHFDPLFFGISPAEAAEMNPSQKLILELMWEAMENTYVPINDIIGKKAGVYVGNIWSDFEHHRKHRHASITSHSAMGQASNIIANRASFTFGFTGPSLVVDTGCSSSLVALHLACQSLWDDSTELAFIAGVNHILDPDQYVLLSKFGGLSAKGKCSTFDAEADGFVRGEGGGVLMLKKLTHAEADGNRILAVIRGSSMNNNGHNASLPATSAAGQKQMLTDAYLYSGIAPADVHYVEAHGTGTRLGDPTEARALGEFFSSGRKTPLHIGSVKTNIGHLEGAAGIAGLIKVVLAIRHRQIPPSLNFHTPNPNIPFQKLLLHVQQQLEPWPASPQETLKAGINSFGWGGTNAHTVIEEYTFPVKATENTSSAQTRWLLPLSAQSPKALKEYATAYLQTLKDADTPTAEKICAATALIKPAFDHRALITATSHEGILEALENHLHDSTITPRNSDKIKLVMVFPGQGTQWLGMGRQLFQTEPVFRQVIEACHNAFAPHTDWSLIGQLHASAATSLLHEIHVIQPMLCALQIALARLWMTWGITPDAVVGHSMGEIAAAHIAGALDLHQAAQIICTRSKLMKRVSGKGGAMAVTELSRTQAEEWAARYPQLSLAVSNSPKSSVLSGDQQTLLEVLAQLEQKNLFARLVKVDVASHSPQMDSLKEDLQLALHDLQPHATIIPILSTVTGKPIEGTAMDACYWVSNLRGTVLFNTAIDKLLQNEHTVFLEISPHPALTNAIQECADHSHLRALPIPSLFRDKPEQESMYKNLAELCNHGYDIDWKKIYAGQRAPHVQLPGYPFQRERHTLEDNVVNTTHHKLDKQYPLIGPEIALAETDTAHFWETCISLENLPFLNDHQVNNIPVLPGAIYVEMILEACRTRYAKGVPLITNLRFMRAVTPQPGHTVTLQLKVRTENKNNTTAQIFQKITTTGEDISWELLAEAGMDVKAWPEYHQPTTQPAGQTKISGTHYYQKLHNLGLQYGPCFNNLKQLSFNAHTSQVHFTLSAHDHIRYARQAYQMHPAMLDACFQSIFAKAIHSGGMSQHTSTTFLTGIEEIQWLGAPNAYGDLHGIAALLPTHKDESRGLTIVKADLIVSNADGTGIFTAKGVSAHIIDTAKAEQQKEQLKNWLYQIRWVKRHKTPSETITSASPQGTWLVLGDPNGLSKLLLEKLKQFDVRCIHVTPGPSFLKTSHDTYTIRYGFSADYRNLLTTVFADNSTVSGILHAGSLGHTGRDPFLTADTVESMQDYGSVSFMHLQQQLSALPLTWLPRLVVVTNGIHDAGSQGEVVQPAHSPLWGMVRVLLNELTQYTCRYIDLSANPDQEELTQLATSIATGNLDENEVAFRGNQCFVPRLMPCAYDVPVTSKTAFSPHATYLVTGFHGIGFRFIEWMVQYGARGFALVSRTGKIQKTLDEKINLLRQQGCRFSVFRADIGNYTEIKTVWDEIENTLPEIKGIVHAAGIIEACAITDLGVVEFQRILNPKVKGAWNLHRLSLQKKLDCFILFSSASTLIGLSGQASYVAANVFLDTLAHCRKRMGLPAMSINWGVIRDVGMVANQTSLEKFARAEGFEPVTMSEALNAFQTIYDTLPAQIGIVKWNIEALGVYYSALAQTPYLEELLKKTETTTAESNDFMTRLATLETKENKLKELTSLITRHVASVVKTTPEKIDHTTTFKALGIDSLMAIRLRNLLEKDLRIKLPVGMFSTRPRITDYADAVYESLGTPNTPAKTDLGTNKMPPVLVTVHPAPLPATRLFCFHDAGGSASLFQGWEEHLGETVQLITVELPGRGAVQGDTAYSRMAPLLRDLRTQITPWTDKPFAFMGHSMGGLLAFELTHELRRHRVTLPSALFISSTPALATYAANPISPLLSDDALCLAFPHLDKKKIADEKLFHTLVHRLRADLTLINNYTYTRKTPLHIPLVILHGHADNRVTSAQARAWRSETKGICTIITRPGGHRYITNDVAFVTAQIRHLLTSTTVQPQYERTHS